MTAAETPPAAPRPRRIKKSRKLAFVLILALGVALAAEGGSRLYWVTQGLGFATCQRHLVRKWYPSIRNLEPVMRNAGESNDEIAILVLGGSSVNTLYGPVATMLQERLTQDLDSRVQIFNLADAGHTSLDSYWKYADLAGKSFDLVLIYDGINDLRANNCPQEMFRDDYRQLAWYRSVDIAAEGAQSRTLAAPATLQLAWAVSTSRLGLARMIPEEAVRMPEWLQYGGEIKTAATLRRNIDAILNLAAERGDKPVLMTFANYQPADYTLEKFRARQLDYVVHWFETELWGTPPNVLKGLAAHNDAIREIAKARAAEALFVDQAALIPPEGRYYDDICHLSVYGCQRFVDNLAPAILPYLKTVVAKRKAR